MQIKKEAHTTKGGGKLWTEIAENRTQEHSIRGWVVLVGWWVGCWGGVGKGPGKKIYNDWFCSVKIS